MVWRVLGQLLLAAAAGAPFAKVLPVLTTPPKPLDPSPYTHRLEENLAKVRGLETAALLEQVGRGLDRETENRKLHALYEARNEVVRKGLTASGHSPRGPQNFKAAETVFKALVSNEVAKVEAVHKYDSRGDIGFCFGRAALVHYLLLKQGVPPEDIAKAFALGSLTYHDFLWEFHMATLVRGKDGKWWAVDSLFDRPLEHGEWMKRVGRLDIKPDLPQVRFYVTDPRKFQPGYGAYEAKQFNIPELRPYFTALFDSLK